MHFVASPSPVWYIFQRRHLIKKQCKHFLLHNCIVSLSVYYHNRFFFLSSSENSGEIVVMRCPHPLRISIPPRNLGGGGGCIYALSFVCLFHFVILFWVLCFRFEFCDSVLGFVILFWGFEFCDSVLGFWVLWFYFGFCDPVLGFVILFWVLWSVSVKRRLGTADCRLWTRGKMQTKCKMQTADWE